MIQLVNHVGLDINHVVIQLVNHVGLDMISVPTLVRRVVGVGVLDDPCRSERKIPPHFGEFASHFEPVIANQCAHWCGNPFPLFSALPLPPSSRTAVFPTCIVEFCRRCVYIIFLPNAVVPDRKIEKRPDRHAVAVEAPRIARNYVNKFCEQIVPFRLVLAWPPC